MSGIDLNFFISIRQEAPIIHFVAWIAIGLVAAFIGSRTLNETRYGLGSRCSVEYCRCDRWRFFISSVWDARRS
jgi:hypothetical protein